MIHDCLNHPRLIWMMYSTLYVLPRVHTNDFDGIPIICHSEICFCSIRISIKLILLSTSHITPDWRVTDTFAQYIGFLAPEALFHPFSADFPLCVLIILLLYDIIYTEKIPPGFQLPLNPSDRGQRCTDILCLRQIYKYCAKSLWRAYGKDHRIC